MGDLDITLAKIDHDWLTGEPVAEYARAKHIGPKPYGQTALVEIAI
jgi:hypothetical protein